MFLRSWEWLRLSEKGNMGDINGDHKGSTHCAKMIRFYSREVLNYFEWASNINKIRKEHA